MSELSKASSALPVDRADNLVDAFFHVVREHPDKGFTFVERSGDTFLAFPDLLERALARADTLLSLGLERGDRVALVIDEPREFVVSFVAALQVGLVPVPLPSPLYLSRLAGYRARILGILASSGAVILLASDRVARSLESMCESERVHVIKVSALADTGRQAAPASVRSDDVAFLQYTSGTTGQPRGVKVSHRSASANLSLFMGRALGVNPERDVGVSWLPLYHDMGLVGFLLSALYLGVPVALIPTSSFIRNAGTWLDTIDRLRGTITFAPNFAFRLALRRVRDIDLERWELSCLRVVGCGAEPIQADTLRAFRDLLGERCGMPPEAISPAYGLAEATLGVTLKPLGQPFRVRQVSQVALETEGRARTPSDGERSVEHVSCGHVAPGHVLAVCDESGRRLPDGEIGEICVAGPSVAAGYWDNEQAWRSVTRAEWLRTGDLGYLDGQELYVTGRIKDLIILSGRNIHPQDIEWEVCTVEGVRPGGAAAFATYGTEGEELTILVETRSPDADALIANVIERVQMAFLVRPAAVVCVKPNQLPRTSSGKLQRAKARRHYEASRNQGAGVITPP